MPPITEVPDSYVGAWERRAEGPAPRSCWLQTRRLHAYLSIPAGRPDFSGKTSLADCDFDELMWLAGQDGAAGACIVEGDVLHRRRQIDYSPQRGLPHLRRMRREDALLHEETLNGGNRIVWRRLNEPGAEIIAFRFQDENVSEKSGEPRKGLLLVAGNHFMFARDRGIYTLHAESLQVLAECKDYGRDELTALLDFEISCGLRAGGAMPWEVTLSTLPFKEGKPLLGPDEFAAIVQNWSSLPQRIQHDGETFLRRWSLDEWTQPGTAP